MTSPTQDKAIPLTPASLQPFSASVRQATRAAHQRLENTAVMRNLMDPGLTVAGYASILRRWHRCWLPLEAALADGARRGKPAALLPASRMHLLERDRAFVQTLMPAHSDAEAPATFDLKVDHLTSTEHGWYGLAYVVQGSLLGGALIRTRLMKSLGLSDLQGTEFFAGGTVPSTLHLQWTSWLALADHALQTPCAVQEATVAADGVFRQMETVFSGESHE